MSMNELRIRIDALEKRMNDLEQLVRENPKKPVTKKTPIKEGADPKGKRSKK